MSVLKPLQSAQYIAQNSKHVFIRENGIKKCSDYLYNELLNKKLDIQRWKKQNLLPKIADKFAIDWIFLTDSLNFSFWFESENENYAVSYQGKQYTGYWSMCAAVNRALDEKIPICDPYYYSNLSIDKLKYIFRSDTSFEMPLLDDRLRILHESGKILIEKFEGSFINCLNACNHEAQKLLEIIIDNFSSFRDEAEYKNKKVSFYKRGQILIADIWACFEGKEYGNFVDIESLTMFADYRIPQCLAYFEVLRYSDDLLAKLNDNYLFKSGEEEEVEIRGCSIWAIELILQNIKEKLNITKQSLLINSIVIDHYLWDYRQVHNEDMCNIPFHKVRCIYY